MPVDALDHSPFGINSHVARDVMLDRLADAGIRWFRFDIDWRKLQPSPDGPFEWKHTDRTVAWAARRGVHLLGSIAYAPEWAWAAGERREHEGQKPRDPAEWASFVEAVVRRYSGADSSFTAGRVAAFSIWNEPNVRRFWDGSQEEYLRLALEPGITAARRAHREAVIVGPDLSSSPSNGDPIRDWLEPILRTEPDFDVISHHQYDGGDELDPRVQLIDGFHRARRRFGRYGEMPLWITEIGFRVPNEVTTVDAQAEALEAVMRAMYSRRWWNKTFWYDSHDDGWGLFEGENMVETPSYGAYTQVTDRAQLARHQVAALARALLGRTGEPSPHDERDWLGHVLGEGGSAEKLATVFLSSSEGRNRRSAVSDEEFCRALYHEVLGRVPGPDEMAPTIRLIGGGKVAQRAAEMVVSPEFRSRMAGTRRG